MNHHQLTSRKGALRVAALGAALALTTALLPGQAASAAPGGKACDNRANNTYQKLLECVTVDGVVEHLEAFHRSLRCWYRSWSPSMKIRITRDRVRFMRARASWLRGSSYLRWGR